MKKFYKENRVFVILMAVAIVCVAIILAMMVVYIVNSSTRNRYGNRLDGISDVKIEEKRVTSMEEEVSAMEKVEKVTINIHGKIVNFNIDVSKDATMDNAKNIAIKCIDLFEEDYKNFYDIQFLINQADTDEENKGFTILGYLKAGRTTISWSQNANSK